MGVKKMCAPVTGSFHGACYLSGFSCPDSVASHLCLGSVLESLSHKKKRGTMQECVHRSYDRNVCIVLMIGYFQSAFFVSSGSPDNLTKQGRAF